MRALGVAVLVLVATAGVVVDVNGQGFRTGITLNGLQNFEQAIITFVNSHFQDLTLPDMHIDTKLPIIGKVEIDLSEITVTDFHIPSASFSLTGPSTIGVGVSGTGLSVKLKFHWKQKDWPHTSDHGDVTAVPKQGDINLDAALSVANEHPYFTCTSATCDFDKIELHFSGHWDDWLYNFFVDLFKNTIKNSVDKAVASALSDTVDHTINAAIAKIPTHLYVGGGESRMDISIATVDASVASSNYVSLANAFSISDNSTGANCPLVPVPLPDVDPSTHQLQFFLAASTLNCAIWVPFVNGAIDFHLPSSVQFWVTYIPQLQTMYPGAVINLDITPIDGQPLVVMAPNLVSASMAFAVNMTTPVNGGNVYLDTLRFDISFGLDLFVAKGNAKQPAGSWALYGNSTNLAVTVSVVETAIGPINTDTLQMVLDVVDPLVDTAVNTVLGIGFPIPLIPGIELIAPSVFFDTGYMGLASDFSFNITESSSAEYQTETEYPPLKIDLNL